MILKYLKLRTIRILRKKYLQRHTCVAVSEIRFSMKKWYCKQVRDYAETKAIVDIRESIIPFFWIARESGKSQSEERKIFLDWLEEEVIADRK